MRLVDRRKGPMTEAELQARRRKRLRHDIEVDGLVEHARRVLHEATATEKSLVTERACALDQGYERDMKAMIRFMVLAAALATAAILAMSHAGAEEQKRLYDAAGRSVGTAVPFSDSSVRYYDARGHSLGTSSTSGGAQGATTTYYDAIGR
jgi:hypothetical protein